MKKEAILHVGKSSYAYAYDEETMHIRVRVAKDDMMSVSLYCADPYEWTLEDGPNNIWAWNRKAFPMSKEFSTSMFDFYTITFKPPYQRLKYGFILNDGQEEVLYLERGFFALNDPSIKNDGNSYFAYPFMSPEDIFKAPAWAKETNWYQIFPERFANGDSSIDPENVLAWDSELPWDFENPEKFFGGDIQGIIDHLNHLEDLGINGIYLTPIFEAPSTHKYDTLDYYKIDPHFGDNETFKTLVKEAHKRGMRIMLDGVFNHIGFTSVQFQDVIKNGENSPYKDWFYINQFPVVDELGEPIAGAYRTFGFTPIMPKLNTNNPEVKQYLIDIATYWVKEFNIDAWRLDVANEIGHVFWREFRQAVKAVNPDVFIVGEAWHDSTPWLQGDQFDSMMNYPLTKGIVEFVATDAIDDQTFIDTLCLAFYRYSQNINEVMFNLLDSHDTIRLASLAKNHKEKIKMCYTMLYSLPGSPCIYYGSEFGVDGDLETLSRKCMPWDETKQDHDYFRHIQKLIKLRQTHPSIGSSGRIKSVYNSNQTIIYCKYTDEEAVYYFFNNSSEQVEMPVPMSLIGHELTELYENKVMTLSETLLVESYGTKIIKA